MAEKKTESLSDVLHGLRNSKKDDHLEVGAFSGFDAKPKGLTTGNITLDSLTGIGGFPAGRITELLGPPSSGKTTSALQCAAKVQQAGGNVFFADFEHALDPVYCESLGLDVYAESFIYAKPDYFEQGANAFRRMVRTGELQLGIFDSVAAMVTKHELEADTGSVTVADRAKMLHQFCLTPDHKVLREDDLRWTPLGDCEVGDVILGFDEFKQAGSGGRNYRRAVVKNVHRQVSEDMYRVTLSSGKQFRVTGNHKWLVAVPCGDDQRFGPRFKYVWRETSNLKVESDHVPQMLDMWEEDMSKDAGWLAGMLDGEGTLVQRTSVPGKHAGGVQIVLGQKMGPEADRVERLLKEFCELPPAVADEYKNDYLPFRRFMVAGALRTKLSLLGTVRPERLIAKLDFENLGRMQTWKRLPETIAKVEKIEPQEIVIMETSTGTFIADGYPMHNCRQLRAELSRYGTGAIFLNHLLELVDATPMGRQLAARGIKRYTSPGGRALPFYASLRVEFKQVGNITQEEVDPLTQEVSKITRQTKTQAVAVKNKVADPFRRAELRVRFGKGFSQPYSVFSILLAHKVLTKKTGGWFHFNEPALYLDDDHAKVQGEETLLQLMEENPEWFSLLEKRAQQIVDALGVYAFESATADDVMDKEGAELQDEDPESEKWDD